MAALFVFGVIAGLGAGSAHADVPIYVGDMGFPAIPDVSGLEDYSWKVQLEDDQELRQVDSRHVQVYYESGHPAMTISAESAHDVTGTTVPTTLEATGDDVITLTVHHRVGNPKADGAPFDYPVLAGPGFESSYQPAIIRMPPEEAHDIKPLEGVHCLVPALKGKSLRASRRRLARNGCGLGRVSRKGVPAKNAKIFGQSPRAGAVLNPGATVSVKLG